MVDLKSTLLPLLLTGALVCAASGHRLTGTVVPVSYRLNLNLTDAAFTNASDSYTGEVYIGCRATVGTTNITLHAAHDFIKIILVSLGPTNVTDYSLNNASDILTINWPNRINAGGNFTIYIQFESRLSTSDMYGFYKSSYVANGVTKYLATTQFQAVYARRAFPCFDEPQYKATFEVTITHPTNLTALSNQLGSVVTDVVEGSPYQTTKFNTTTIMSSYLLAFVVSDFTCTPGENIEQIDATTSLIPYHVCSRNETTDIRAFAVEIGPKLLQSLNRFTDFNYSAMGMEKMDQIAIPDFAAGAMENWGLVTYREALLLYDNNESTNANRQSIATVISHEFAHMWFGNLVTNNWWSELFLNEGFATYFEYFATHDVLPSWELDKYYILQVVQRALEADSLDTSHALQHNVNTAAEVMGRFGTISYQKGGSILRMAEHILGSENFRRGLQAYLKLYAHKNTVPENLWDSLEAAATTTALTLPENTNFSTVMNNWVTKPGFPVINVTHANQAIIIIQAERFLLSGNDIVSKWYVPLSYTIDTDPPSQFFNTTPRAWLHNLGVWEIPASNWIILNNQASGFYRVHYNDILWTRIAAALNTTTVATPFSGIPDLTRAQLVDDAFAFASINKRNYSSVFDFIDFLRHDDSIYPWTPALSGFNSVLRRVGHDSRLGDAMKTHLIDLMQSISNSVPFRTLNDTNHAYTMKQTTVLTTACRVGEEACVNQALERFGEFRLNRQRVPKNLRLVIYCNALRYSEDTAQQDWNLLWGVYQTTQLASEKVQILNALGCTRNESLLRNYLTMSLDPNSGIRPQDALNVFTSVYSSNDAGVDIAFEFLTQNHRLIAERYTSMNALSNMIRGIANRFTTERQVIKLREFIQSDDLDEDFKLECNRALTTAETNMEWLKTNTEELYGYYGLSVEEEETSSTTSTSTSSTTSSTTTEAPSGAVRLNLSILTLILAFTASVLKLV